MYDLISELTPAQICVIYIYSSYTLLRAVWGVGVGLKYATVGNGATSIKIYHILWVIIDIPAIILGMIIRVFIIMLSIPVIRLRNDKK